MVLAQDGARHDERAWAATWIAALLAGEAVVGVGVDPGAHRPGQGDRHLHGRTDVPGLYVLPAGNRTASDSEYLTSNRTAEVLARLTDGAPNRMLIFDSPPALAASPAADRITWMQGASNGEISSLLARVPDPTVELHAVLQELGAVVADDVLATG